jgi:hypothetical protein
MQYPSLPVRRDQQEHSSVSLSGSKGALLVVTAVTQETVTDLTVSAGVVVAGAGALPGGVVSVV